MKKIFNLIAGGLLAFIIFPINTFAYSNWGQNVQIFSLFDVFFDILGFSAAVVAFSIGLEMLRKFSGKLRIFWVYCNITVLIFLILQVMSFIAAFYFIDFSGIFPILKFLMGTSFLCSVFVLKGMVHQIARNKSIQKREQTNILSSKL